MTALLRTLVLCTWALVLGLGLVPSSLVLVPGSLVASHHRTTEGDRNCTSANSS
jgi:hypothetical protein